MAKVYSRIEEIPIGTASDKIYDEIDRPHMEGRLLQIAPSESVCVTRLEGGLTASRHLSQNDI